MNTPAKRARKRSDSPDPLAPQRELTPAPVAPAAPAANDEARASLTVIGTQLAKFDQVEAASTELERKYKDVAYSVDTKKGMDDACEARRLIKAPRVELEHARVTAKAPLLKLGRDIDARAQVITARLVAIEKPIDDQIKAQEKKEADRKADLERRVDEIRRTPAQCIGKKSQQLQEVLDGLNSLPLADFQEYREQAAKAQLDATLAVNTLLTTAKQAEELADLQEKQRKEQLRKDAIQQAIEAIGAPLQQLPMCRTSTRVQALIDNAEAVQIPEAVYQEFAAAAREKKAAVLAELTKVRDEKKAAEDARAAAAAISPPTDHPTAAMLRGTAAEHAARAAFERESGDGLPAGAARIYGDEPIGRTDHDRINDEGAASLHRAFGSAGARGPSRSLESDFRRVMAGRLEPARNEPDGPFSEPTRSILSYETVQTGKGSGMLASPEAASAIREAIRPADAEILAVVADHYEVDAATAAAWLRTFDAAAALAQQSLIPTT